VSVREVLGLVACGCCAERAWAGSPVGVARGRRAAGALDPWRVRGTESSEVEKERERVGEREKRDSGEKKHRRRRLETECEARAHRK
jgi:hypothetical protein